MDCQLGNKDSQERKQGILDQGYKLVKTTKPTKTKILGYSLAMERTIEEVGYKIAKHTKIGTQPSLLKHALLYSQSDPKGQIMPATPHPMTS